ncbi:WD40 repeat domain-containing protein [Lewinella sp. IMCC34191]|uniref:WD40 repeat domain-containing protein n=1 Tax=Lewinella sp. IMCC34191 TaxID=2259172 RepID=UPI0013002C9F|nr:WD40 repeat domain-containing protein [Lewinella sp. IMCC34191]
MSSTEFLPSNLACVFVLSALLSSGCVAPAMIKGEYESIVWSVDWAGPQHAIIVGGNQHEITTFSGGNLEPQLTIPVAGTITNLKWDPKGEYLAAAAQSGEVPFVYDLNTGRRTVLDSVSSSGARGLGWSPDGTYLAVGDNDGYLLLFKRDGVLYRRRKIDPKAITGLDWHPAGNHLVTVGSGIGTYDIAADTARFRMSRELPTLMLSIAWHPDGNSFATGDYGEPENGILLYCNSGRQTTPCCGRIPLAGPSIGISAGIRTVRCWPPPAMGCDCGRWTAKNFATAFATATCGVWHGHREEANL